jgi:hypothetical protein
VKYTEQVGQLGLFVRLHRRHGGQDTLPPVARGVRVERGQVIDGGGHSGEVGERRGAGLETLGHVRRRGRQFVGVDALEQ